MEVTYYEEESVYYDEPVRRTAEPHYTFTHPASIYGMVILFTALCTGLIKLSAVKETGKFLIYIMPMMFIPATVGLLESWSVMQEFLTAIIVISLVSTVLVMVFTGHVTQFIIKLKNKEDKQ